MINRHSFISYTLIALLVVLGSLVLGSERASAQCTLDIQKIANPPSDTAFNFTAPGATPDSFTLRDPSDPTISLSLPFATEVIVSELLPFGWRVEDIICENTQFNGVSITEGPLENELTLECLGKQKQIATCSFMNILERRNIPTLSEWGLIILAVALGIFSLYAGRKKLIKS